MKEQSYQYFPLALFSSVMGLAVTTIAINQIENIYQINKITSAIFLAITTLWFLFNSTILIYRLIFFPKEVKQEYSHPIQMNFFAAISISLLLISTLYASHFKGLSFIIWGLGAILQVSFTVLFLHNIIWKKEFEFKHFTPLSFLPIVGNLVVPIGGSLHVHEQINWFFFGFGILFSMVYIAFLFHRLFFRNPLPNMMLPTIFILMAPPAVGFIAYVSLTGKIDVFANILYGSALFIGLLLTLQLKRIFSNPFGLPSWALLFPSGAMTVATIMMYAGTGFTYYQALILPQMITLLIFLFYLSWNTFKAARAKKLCAAGK